MTGIIQSEGNGLYTLNNLEAIELSDPYCSTGTNFAGWAITIIYSDPLLPLNQLNIYDGLESVPDSINIELNNLNVMDTNGARIGFIAWEGDVGIAVNESLTMNGITLSNPPLNPSNNAFNGTNSFTNDSNLYNMDIDVYPIENTINVGDISATIQLTSGQDLVMVNNIITVLNSQLPDATVSIDSVYQDCNPRELTVEYTVNNLNSTHLLPANTPIAFYADAVLVAQSQTINDILINDSESNIISFDIDSSFLNTINLTIVVDDTGVGNGIITEISETNNTVNTLIDFLEPSEPTPLSPLFGCNFGNNEAVFKNISKMWQFNFPKPTQEVAITLNKWNDWRQFEIEMLQTPKSTLSAFQMKTKNLSSKADSLTISMPIDYNRPQILSRLSTLNTKLKSLETFLNLRIIPQQKVAKLIPEINEEIKGLYKQWDEIIIKKDIPKEIGEELMLQALDTARNANPDEMRKKMENSNKIK